MKIHVFAHCRNECAMAGFFARHYSVFADRITIFDDSSDDGTQAILALYPKITVIPLKMDALDEHALLELAHSTIHAHSNLADWCIWPDMDEFLHAENIRERLARHQQVGHQVIRAVGFNMMSRELPEDDGVSQLTAVYRTGVRAPVYSKPIIVRPNAGAQWSRGKHSLDNEAVLSVSPFNDEYQPDPWRIKLLHYRFLNPSYCRERNARQYARSSDKSAAWSCAPDYHGEHSPDWVAATQHLARDVVNDDACYLPAPFDA